MLLIRFIVLMVLVVSIVLSGCIVLIVSLVLVIFVSVRVLVRLHMRRELKLHSILLKSYGMKRKTCKELELPLLSS